MSISEKLVSVAENVPKVYAAGQKSMVDESKIIQKTAMGTNILSLDDVSEVPHKLEVSLASKNLIDFSRSETDIVFSACTLSDDKKTVTSSFTDDYYSQIILYYLNDLLLQNKGKTFTFSVKEVYEDVSLAVVIWGDRTSGAAYQNMHTENGATSITFTVADDFTSISKIELRFNRKGVAFTTNREFTEFQLEKGSEATEYTPCVTDFSNVTVTVGDAVYTASHNGTVEGVQSVSPNMTLTVDSDEICITATYHRSYGMQVEYDRFWDSFLQNGNRTDYLSAFTGGGWTSETLRPKYKCTPIGPAGQMFYLCGYESKQGVIDFRTIADKFDFSKVTNGASMFYSAAMDFITADLSSATTISSAFNGGYTSKITTLTLKLTPTTTDASGAFTYQRSLKNLTFTDDSEIACNLNFKDCTALTHDSLMSIINALQDGVTSKTLTLGSTNLAKLTDAEKAKATQKGWTLA